VRPSGAAPYRQAAHGAHSSLSLSGECLWRSAKAGRCVPGSPRRRHTRSGQQGTAADPQSGATISLSGRDAQPGMERQDRARDGARDEVNALLDLDIKMLRQKWRSVMGLAVRAKAVGNLGIGLTPDVPLSPIAIVAETVAGTPKPAFRELRGHRMHQQRRIRGLVAGRRCGQTWRTVASPAGLRRALEDDRVV
jgi:hypothetical protein